MVEIKITHVDQTWVKVHCDKSRMMELKDVFSFFQAGYRFNPKFKSGYWDGRISLINFKTLEMYKGLIPAIHEFCDNRGYKLVIDDQALEGYGHYQISESDVPKLFEKFGGPYTPHSSQIKTVAHCINNDRSIIIAPTNNGKSYAMHGVASFYAKMGLKVLVIIHRTQLIEQLRKNLAEEYKGSQHFKYNTVYDRIGDKIDSNVYFTTWQSCVDNDVKWFRQFDMLMGDEVHMFKAESLKTIINKCAHIKYRHGFTATLDNDSKIDQLILTGMFGLPERVSTVQEDIDAGISSRPTIYAILREYSPTMKRTIIQKHGVRTDTGYHLPFQNEKEFLENSVERNQFICKLESQMIGNTLISFRRDEHGQNIIRHLRAKYDVDDKPLYYINHTIKPHVRIKYVDEMKLLKSSTAVVSIGTFSAGINMPNIHNIINAVQIQSTIDVNQLVGRGLRIDSDKNTLNVYDLGDDLTYKGQPNTTFKHFKTRLQIYAEQGYEIKLIKYQVPDAESSLLLEASVA